MVSNLTLQRQGFIYGQKIIRTRKYCCLAATTTTQKNNFHQKRHQRQHNNNVSFSQTSYRLNSTLTWAQSNPRLAQECLNPPSWWELENCCWNDEQNDGPEKQQVPQSLEAYLKWRKWTFPKEIIQLRKEEGRENATALISHILSAPLTLANQLSKHINNNNINTSKDIIYNLCCIGARAEASIPTPYWKEFLMLSMASLVLDKSKAGSNNRDDGGQSSFPNLQISLDFIGPDILPNLLEQSIYIPTNNNKSTLSIRGFHRGLFHEIPSINNNNNNQNSRYWDTYIFFNPGFGHPNLQNSWKDTLEIIVGRRNQGNSDPCSLILTAHSEKDAMRDSNILSNVYGLKNIEYHENPFASRIAYEDPFEKGHFVRPNHYVATVIM
ncbi:MAG: hypothetical protein ACI8RD_002261 [Bacillariaceae sp.]|jgi:hypothetical protein